MKIWNLIIIILVVGTVFFAGGSLNKAICTGETMSTGGYSLTLNSMIKPATGLDKANLELGKNGLSTTGISLNINNIKNTYSFSDADVSLTLSNARVGDNCISVNMEVVDKNSCVDDDGGMNTYKKGVLNHNGYLYSDYCTVSNKVKEYYCGANNEIKSYYSTCPTDYSCSDGACVKDVEKPSCSDSDGGIIKKTKGSVTYDGKTYDDVCVSDKKVNEYYCGGDTVHNGEYVCDLGYSCSDGACVKDEVTSNCSDSDGTDNYQKGTVNYNGYTYTDYCTSDKVKEYYCGANNEIKSYYSTCPTDYSCSDGACVKDEEKPSCSDSDGYNIYVKGTRTTNLGTAVESCKNSNTVIETYCLETKGYTTNVDCPTDYSCSDGACVKDETNQESNTTEYIFYETVKLKNGWNLISTQLSEIIYTNCGDIKSYKYNEDENKYDAVDLTKENAVGTVFKTLKGYWVHTKGNCIMEFGGEDKSNYNNEEGIEVNKGWITLGGTKPSTSWDSMKGNCIAEKGPWRFDTANNKWIRTNTLNEGIGYFVKLENDCTLGTAIVGLPPLPE